MICKIAELIVEVPEAGGMAPRCRDYLCTENVEPDIVIDPGKYRYSRYPATSTQEQIAYRESGRLFHQQLAAFDALYLHAAAVGVDGKAYLFSGPSGIGKTTHTTMWQELLGNQVCRINDDKPVLRRLDGAWYVYGTPWCGKDGINRNVKVPLAGICFLKQGQENAIRKLHHNEAAPLLLCRTIHRYEDSQELDMMLTHLERLVLEIPVYELVNRPELDAARLSYETMRKGAQEAGL